LRVGLEVHSAGVQDLDGALDVLKAVAARYPMVWHVFADGGYAGPKLRDTLKAIGRWTVQIVKRCGLHSRRIMIATRNLDGREPGIIRRLRLEPRIAAPRLNPVATHTVFLCQHRSIHAISTAIRDKLAFETIHVLGTATATNLVHYENPHIASATSPASRNNRTSD
jgi:hypothetical protein